jgi:hypothetical protein
MTSSTLQADSEPLSFEVPPPAFDAPSPDDSLTFELPFPEAAFSFDVPAPERREKPRDVIRVLARIRLDDEPPLDVHTIDLSSHGIAITSTRPLNVDLECNVELGISAPEIARPPALRASVRYCARLRDDQYRIGMKFTKVSVEAAELIVAVLGL